ncbi:hypothetical protein [uncultured Marinococcus sp.]|uniref:hypothetical protein n=1 Tax=uncultured Marinococcus sp. TaxID=487012 RepID=UPI00261D7455|nr:hypothetical protein [uncultured Marinococcus sp.]
MLDWEIICITTVAGRLPYIEEEIWQAQHHLHAMEYQVWQAWREAWSSQECPRREQSQRQAMFEVSGAQGLSVPVVQEMVRYAENRVWLTLPKEETNL